MNGCQESGRRGAGQQGPPARTRKKASISASVPRSPSQLKSALPQQENRSGSSPVLLVPGVGVLVKAQSTASLLVSTPLGMRASEPGEVLLSAAVVGLPLTRLTVPRPTIMAMVIGPS